MEARIHIANPSPPYCAACFQAVPGKRHIDFGASTDGPTLAPVELRVLDGTTGHAVEQPVVGVVGHTVDEIVICEDCVKQAAALIGLGDADELTARIASLETANDELHAQLAGTREAVGDALDAAKRRLTGEQRSPSTPNSLLPLPGRKPRQRRKAVS